MKHIQFSAIVPRVCLTIVRFQTQFPLNAKLSVSDTEA